MRVLSQALSRSMTNRMRVLYAFGNNEDGQCYSANKKEYVKDIWVPIIVKFPSCVQIVSVSAGSRHSLALSAEGQVYSWGWGHVGQLGHGDTSNCYQPKRIEKLTNKRVLSISAGGMHSACITADHGLYTWGCNTYGQLGIGKNPPSQTDEAAVLAPSQVFLILENGPPEALLAFKVSCGGCHTVVIEKNQVDLYAWGKADSGQCGSSTWYLDFSNSIYTPYLVPPFLSHPPSSPTSPTSPRSSAMPPSPPSAELLVDIACGGFYTLVLSSVEGREGRVWGMGKEDFGCLGVLCEENAEAPTLVSSLSDAHITSISAGGWHSSFLSQSGVLYMCGKGEYGRLGLGGDASSLLPTPLSLVYPPLSSAPSLSPLSPVSPAPTPLLEKVVQASGGGAHTLLLLEGERGRGGRVYATGRLDQGRCATRSSNNNSSDRTYYAQDVTSSFPPPPPSKVGAGAGAGGEWVGGRTVSFSSTTLQKRENNTCVISILLFYCFMI